jgi:two-component system chemotaxis response regulator CheB
MESSMPEANNLRVLIVDDTVIYRKIVSDIITELPGVEVAGSAHNGRAALAKVNSLKPDLLTLDIEMPEMSGIEVLAELRKSAPHIGVIMLSTLTQEGGEMTMKALELGAFDFIPKPQSGTMAENREAIKDILASMLQAYSRRHSIRTVLRGTATPKTSPPPAAARPVVRPAAAGARKRSRAEIVAVGISTGGPNALAVMLPAIPANVGVPIVIVQHMPPVFTQSLANSLDKKCAIHVKEAVNGEAIRPNTAYIAPGGRQMKLVAGADGKNRMIRITDDPPENSCRPSVDYLFRSIAQYYIGRATGVIMTGMGSDGSAGLRIMKQNGSTVIAQDEASCVVFGMPKEPIETGIVDIIAPLDKIAAEIVKTVR